MTGRNPNVFYEVGYAHAKGKLCTLLTQDVEDIPFDLKHNRHIVYGGSILNLKELLTPEISWLKSEAHRQKEQPLTVTLPKTLSGLLVTEDWRDKGTIELRFDIRNNSKKRSPEIEHIYIYTSGKWTLTAEGQECITMNDGEKIKHFVKSPTKILSPGGWVPLVIHGERKLWSKFSGEARKSIYVTSGSLTIELQTSEGIVKETFSVSATFDEVPF